MENPNLLTFFNKNLQSVQDEPQAGTMDIDATRLEASDFINEFVLKYGSIRSGIFTEGTTGWRIKANGDAQLNNIDLTGGTISYGKTSFTDSTNAGYYISSDGIYFGAVSDATKMKYNISSGALEITNGTITGGTIQTGASDGRIKLAGGDSSIVQTWLNDDEKLAEIYVSDIDAQYQSLQFVLYNTTAHTGTAFSMTKNASKLLFYPNTSGDLGTTSYPWTDIYSNGNLVFWANEDKIIWENSTSSVGHLASISLRDNTEQHQCLIVTVSDYVASPASNTPVSAYFESQGSDIEFRPASGNNGRLGDSTNYWKYLYSNYVYYKNLGSFESHDDISLVKNIKEKPMSQETKQYKVKDKNSKEIIKETAVWDEKTMPEEVYQEGFYDVGAVNGLLIGVVKQMIEKVEWLEQEIKTLKQKIK